MHLKAVGHNNSSEDIIYGCVGRRKLKILLFFFHFSLLKEVFKICFAIPETSKTRNYLCTPANT